MSWSTCRKDLFVSWLFQTCIRLQTSLDRSFARFDMTALEASVLLRCVDAKQITPGQLATAIARDKGMATRLIHRLEAKGLVVRGTDRRDRRISIIRPTRKGRSSAQRLELVFNAIRGRIFNGIATTNLHKLAEVLRELHKNALRAGSLGGRYRVRE